ncbi:MAG TPA: polymer-forming cytoskeletal family protein [Candidatus Hydrogenedentes bacterium]|nr:polymer-forming cytoskeletal family protein [Candidatus Hydrogenedentota bacterium]
MLDSRKTKTYNENKVVTMIGPGTLFTGELKCKGTIRIEGSVDGKVLSEDSIVVLESGRIKGDLSAGQVIVSGEVHGNIQAVDRIEITERGKVVGDICAPRISIHEGVLFEGQCAMKAEGAATAAKPPQS